ncbi:MAG: hypothetical protein V1861_02420 [Candidatus Micrarchaeota archaeon]
MVDTCEPTGDVPGRCIDQDSQERNAAFLTANKKNAAVKIGVPILGVDFSKRKIAAFKNDDSFLDAEIFEKNFADARI